MFPLQNVIRRVAFNQDGLNVNGDQQLLVYVDDVNMSGGTTQTLW